LAKQDFHFDHGEGSVDGRAEARTFN